MIAIALIRIHSRENRLSDIKTNELSYVYTTLHVYLELGFIESSTESYRTSIDYYTVSSSTISSTFIVRFLP